MHRAFPLPVVLGRKTATDLVGQHFRALVVLVPEPLVLAAVV